MNQTDTLELAKQAGIEFRRDVFHSEYCDGVDIDDLVAFATLVAKHEREACDAICLEVYEWAENLLDQDEKHFAGRMRAAQDIGNAIRTRGQE